METRAPYAVIGMFVLAVIGGIFGFVYWLHSGGGLGERTAYRIRFENTVSGLLTGAAVLFNGIRVGEVTALDLDTNNPNRVMATIAVLAATPIREDTKVSLDFQGLTGVPIVILQGGTIPLRLSGVSAKEPYVLSADPLAGQSMTAAARDALRRLDGILSDNADSIRSTIVNLNTFAGALARNADKLDGIVAGLERMTGGATATALRVVYDLTAPKIQTPIKIPDSQLIVAEPSSLLIFDSRKILVRPSDTEDRTFASAEWVDSVPKLLQAKIIQTFENAGLERTIARTTDGVTADNQLVIEIRKFQLTRGPAPQGEIEIAAKVVSAKGRVVDAHVFYASAPAAAMNASAAAAALDDAFGRCATDLVKWAASAI